MDSRTRSQPPEEGRIRELMASTRQGITARLSDPYLTEHDRWVLRQFDHVLAGSAPDPDPRAVSARIDHASRDGSMRRTV